MYTPHHFPQVCRDTFKDMIKTAIRDYISRTVHQQSQTAATRNFSSLFYGMILCVCFMCVHVVFVGVHAFVSVRVIVCVRVGGYFCLCVKHSSVQAQYKGITFNHRAFDNILVYK